MRRKVVNKLIAIYEVICGFYDTKRQEFKKWINSRWSNNISNSMTLFSVVLAVVAVLLSMKQIEMGKNAALESGSMLKRISEFQVKTEDGLKLTMSNLKILRKVTAEINRKLGPDPLNRSVVDAFDRSPQTKPVENNAENITKNSKPISEICKQEDINCLTQPQPVLKVLVSNFTKKDTEFKESVKADRGDDLYFKILITNNTNHTFKELAAYIQIPLGLSYVNGYSKLYYTDENNQDRAAPLGDYIASANGVMIGNLPAKHYEYIVYKVKVGKNAPSGTYQTGNMIFNGSEIKISVNDAKVKIDVVE